MTGQGHCAFTEPVASGIAASRWCRKDADQRKVNRPLPGCSVIASLCNKNNSPEVHEVC